MSRRALAFWVLVAATAAVWGAMVFWTLPQIAADAGGLRPFDMRPFGYSEAEARAFLLALGPEGRALYSGPQRLLDAVFPALQAATFGVAILYLSRGFPARGRLGLVALPVMAMVADWLENALVAAMLDQPAEAVPAGLIAQASAVTFAKSALVTASSLTLLGLLGLRALRRRGD